MYKLQFARIKVAYDAIITFIDVRKHVVSELNNMVGSIMLNPEDHQAAHEKIHDCQKEIMSQISLASDIIQHEVYDSFREIIAPMNHHHACYYILI